MNINIETIIVAAIASAPGLITGVIALRRLHTDEETEQKKKEKMQGEIYNDVIATLRLELDRRDADIGKLQGERDLLIKKVDEHNKRIDVLEE